VVKGTSCAEPMLEEGRELVFAISSWRGTRSGLEHELVWWKLMVRCKMLGPVLIDEVLRFGPRSE
jgi:hypothetical protein